MNKTITTQTKKDAQEYLSKNQSAFRLLVQNYKQEQEVSLIDFVKRLQTEYALKDGEEDFTRTAREIEQEEYHLPNDLNYEIDPVSAGRHSSFALKEVDDYYELRYPLAIDYATKLKNFTANDITDEAYNQEIKFLKDTFGIKVDENSANLKSYTKSNAFAVVKNKFKNAFLKLTKKNTSCVGIFDTKVVLKSSQANYKISKVEKLTKIYDLMFKKLINKQAKILKKESKIKVSRDVKFGARLFADLLFARIKNYGKDNVNNKNLERSIMLQFSNLANRANFSSLDFKKIVHMGTQAAENMADLCGYSSKYVKNRMLELGFTYQTEPENIRQALLEVMENPAYLKTLAEDLNKTTVKDKSDEYNFAIPTALDTENTSGKGGKNGIQPDQPEEIEPTPEDNTQDEKAKKQDYERYPNQRKYEKFVKEFDENIALISKQDYSKDLGKIDKQIEELDDHPRPYTDETIIVGPEGPSQTVKISDEKQLQEIYEQIKNKRPDITEDKAKLAQQIISEYNLYLQKTSAAILADGITKLNAQRAEFEKSKDKPLPATKERIIVGPQGPKQTTRESNIDAIYLEYNITPEELSAMQKVIFDYKQEIEKCSKDSLAKIISLLNEKEFSKEDVAIAEELLKQYKVDIQKQNAREFLKVYTKLNKIAEKKEEDTSEIKVDDKGRDVFNKTKEKEFNHISGESLQEKAKDESIENKKEDLAENKKDEPIKEKPKDDPVVNPEPQPVDETSVDEIDETKLAEKFKKIIDQKICKEVAKMAGRESGKTEKLKQQKVINARTEKFNVLSLILANYYSVTKVKVDFKTGKTTKASILQAKEITTKLLQLREELVRKCINESKLIKQENQANKEMAEKLGQEYTEIKLTNNQILEYYIKENFDNKNLSQLVNSYVENLYLNLNKQKQEEETSDKQ